MTTRQRFSRLDPIRVGALAGVVGGGMEIGWIILVAALTNVSAANVARGVSVTVGFVNFSSTQAIVAGTAIHMVLAAALGIAVAIGCYSLVGRWFRGIHVYTIVAAALIGVWALNFLVVLPLINPEFVHLMPYPVSLVSKLLFGLSAAEVLRRKGHHRLQRSGSLTGARFAAAKKVSFTQSLRK